MKPAVAYTITAICLYSTNHWIGGTVAVTMFMVCLFTDDTTETKLP